MHTWIHTQTYRLTKAHRNMCTYAHSHTHICMYSRAHTHIHTPRHIWTHINTQIHRHTHTDVIMRTGTSPSQLKGFWFKIPMESLLVCKCRIQERGRHIHIHSNTHIHRCTLIFQGTALNSRKGGWRCGSVVKDIYCSSRGVPSSDSSTHVGQLTTTCNSSWQQSVALLLTLRAHACTYPDTFTHT